MVLCSLNSAFLLLFRDKHNNDIDDAMYPVLSAQSICRIAAMTKLGRFYFVICITLTGEQVSMVTKPRSLELLGHSVSPRNRTTMDNNGPLATKGVRVYTNFCKKINME